MADTPITPSSDNGFKVLFLCVIAFNVIAIFVVWAILRYYRNRDEAVEQEEVHSDVESSIQQLVRESIISNNLTTFQRRAILESIFSHDAKSFEKKLRQCPKSDDTTTKNSTNNKTENVHSKLEKPNCPSSPSEKSGIIQDDTPVNTPSTDSCISWDDKDYLGATPTIKRKLFTKTEDQKSGDSKSMFLLSIKRVVLDTSCGENMNKTEAESKPSLNNEVDEENLRSDDSDSSTSMCPICLDGYAKEDCILASKYCSHFFHKECIMQWLEKHDDCPFCRELMITAEEVKIAASKLLGKQPMRSVIKQFSDIAYS